MICSRGHIARWGDGARESCLQYKKRGQFATGLSARGDSGERAICEMGVALGDRSICERWSEDRAIYKRGSEDRAIYERGSENRATCETGEGNL